MNPQLDYIEKFKEIWSNAKSKKHLFDRLKKKASCNITEAIHEFESVAKHLATEDQCPQYAALFCVAQAKCENSLGNKSGEAAALIFAGQLYISAEDDLQNTCSVSLHENLDSAVACFNQAAKIYYDGGFFMLAGNTCLQIGDSLRRFYKISEASLFYQRAASHYESNSLIQLTALERLASCRISLRDFHSALITYTHMQDLALRHSAALLGSVASGNANLSAVQLVDNVVAVYARCEILRLLILLLIGTPPAKLSPAHVTTLERFSWTEREDSTCGSVVGLSEHIFILLQSVFLAVQTQNRFALESLQADLVPLLDDEQAALLNELLSEIRAPRADAL